MTDDKLKAKYIADLKEEIKNPWQWYYVSFADEVFLGAVVLQARGPLEANALTKLFGINPGGEALMLVFPKNFPIPPQKYRNKLLTKEQVFEMWPDADSLKNLEKEFGSLHEKD